MIPYTVARPSPVPFPVSFPMVKVVSPVLFPRKTPAKVQRKIRCIRPVPASPRLKRDWRAMTYPPRRSNKKAMVQGPVGERQKSPQSPDKPPHAK